MGGHRDAQMKIIYVIDSMTKDGAESQLLKTLARLAPERYEAYVVLSRAVGERATELAALPCVREVTTLVGDGRRATLLEKTFALAGIVKAVQPQLVHSWLWYSNFLCGLSRKLGFWRQVPFIASQRGDYHARYGRFRLWLTEKIIYNTADTVLTNSEQIQHYLCKRYPNKNIFAIPNLLELPAEDGTSRQNNAEEKSILSVGRFAAEKGHRYLIEALRMLNAQYPENTFAWRCTFLGEGELETELRHLVAEYKLAERITFPGFCDDVFSVLSTADVFVLPSLHESSPNALIEAMGMGLPCIASDVGGIAALIDDGENGIRVAPQDAGALAAALHQLLTEPDFATALGKNARATIQQKFNNDESMRKLEEIYQRVV